MAMSIHSRWMEVSIDTISATGAHPPIATSFRSWLMSSTRPSPSSSSGTQRASGRRCARITALSRRAGRDPVARTCRSPDSSLRRRAV